MSLTTLTDWRHDVTDNRHCPTNDIKAGMSDLGIKWSYWPQIGQIRDFFRSDFSTFDSDEPNVLKSDLKSPGFVQFGANMSHLGLI